MVLNAAKPEEMDQLKAMTFLKYEGFKTALRKPS